MKENKIICLDIGGTALKYGVLNTDGKILEAHETPSLASDGKETLCKVISGAAKEMQEKYPEASGIAVSSAGVVNSDTATIVHANDSIPDYIGCDFRKELGFAGLPVEAENDVNCAGLCEAADGSAAGAKSALILTIGTGIGGCFLEAGNLLHGNSYSACEVGYLRLNGEKFEKQAAASALVRNVAKRKNEPLEEWNGRKIFELAAKKDAICQEEIKALAKKLGEGIAALCFILNPEVVVLGGGIMAQEKIFAPLIQESFEEASIPLIVKNTKIRYAQAQNAAGMKGALIHFLQKHPELA